MSRLYRNVLKELFWKAKDTKWIVLMTAIVMIMVSVIYAVGDHIVYSYVRVVNQTSPYDCRVVDVTEEELESLMDPALYGDTVGFMAAGISTMEAWPAEGHLYFGVNSLTGDWQHVTGLTLVEGEVPTTDWEIVLESPAKKYLPGGCKVGDTITLRFFSPKEDRFVEKEFLVTGFLQEVSGTSGFLNAVTGLHTGRLLREALQGEQRGEQITYQIFYKAKADKESAVYAMYDSILSLGLKERFMFNDARGSARQELDFGKSFSRTFKGLAMFIAVISFAMLYNLIHISMHEKIRKLGMLKCLGMNGRQMGLALGFCGLLYLLLGAMCGIVGYTLVEHTLGAWLLGQFAGSFNTGDTAMVFHLDYTSFWVGALVVALIFAVVYGLLIRKVHGLSPLAAAHFQEASENLKQARNKTGKKENLIAYLGQRNLGRNRMRSFYTAFTLGIAGLLFMVVFNVFANTDLVGSNLMLKKAEQFDLEFYGEWEEAFVDESFLHNIWEDSRIENLVWGRRMPEGYLMPEKKLLVEVRSYPDELVKGLCEEYGLDSDRYLAKPSVFCVLGEDVPAERELEICDMKGALHTITIDDYLPMDFYSQYGITDGISLVMNEAATRELLGEEYGYNMFMVKTDLPGEVQASIEEQMQQQGYQLYCGNLNQSVDRARKELKGIVMIAAYILLCIGFMTLVNLICNIDINIRLRGREYGIMAALGMEEKRIVQLIIYEMTRLAQITLVITMTVALMFSLGIVTSVNENPSYIKLLATSLLGAGSLYGVVYAISFCLGRKKYRNNVAPMLHEE